MRLLPIHRARGQCYVPADLLAAAGTSADRFVSEEPGEGAVRALVAFIALAREHLDAFVGGAAGLPRSLRPAYLPLAVTARYLARLERAGADPLARVIEISALSRHSALLRHARKGWR